MTSLIQSNSGDGLTESKIHVATRREMRTDKTERLMGVYYVPACGTRLSSAYGSTTFGGSNADITCARCATTVIVIGFELFYQSGGHCGPFETELQANTEAIRRLDRQPSVYGGAITVRAGTTGKFLHRFVSDGLDVFKVECDPKTGAKL